MANKTKGIVEYIGQKGKGWNAKLSDGQWYSMGFKAPVFGKGDLIEFEWEASGNFRNAVFSSIVVVPKPQQPEVVSGGSSEAQEAVKSNYWDEKDRRITFMACQKDAINIVELALGNDALSLGAAKNKKLGNLLNYVDEITRELFSKVVSGDYEVQTSTESSADKGEAANTEGEE